MTNGDTIFFMKAAFCAFRPEYTMQVCEYELCKHAFIHCCATKCARVQFIMQDIAHDALCKGLLLLSVFSFRSTFVRWQFEEHLAELITVTSKDDSEKDIDKSWGEKNLSSKTS